MYIGAPAFGARQAAGNSLEDLAEVVTYAHTYGVQVLVTLNTLLHDDEYAQADRTPEHVAQLRDVGFKRVVLARELGIDEIRAIHHTVPDIELEAFVHGALCVSYSGRCYISEVLANRSANRGACAQFCRMAYDLLDANGDEVLDEQGQPIHQRYLLSLQDLDRSAWLQELIDAGVTTFKIEGRLKDADYVTNITAYYREKLDAFCHQHSVISRSFTPNPSKTFHRGATDYFLHGRTRPMANWNTPKSTGEYIGEVLEARGNTLRVHLQEGVTLHNGDGLLMANGEWANGESTGFSVNGVEGNIVKINKALTNHQSPITNPIPLYRNNDVEFTKNLHSERRIPVDIVFRETENGFELSYRSSFIFHHSFFIYPKEPAKNEAKALDTIRTQLSKLGDTPYVAREITIESKPYFIPISILNEWRRQIINRQS